MYQKIMDITDQLFQDIEMTEEAQVLKEELTADLNERYADLLAEGVSEDEAIRQIKADLADFGELTRRFPHRNRSVVPVAQDAIPAASLTEIRVYLGSDDLSVIPSEDQQVHLELTGDPNAHWHSELNNGCLALKIEREENTGNEQKTPDSLSGWLLRTLNIIASSIDRQTCHGTIRVPANWRRSMDISTGSGDVSIDLPLRSLKLNTGSGDVDVRLFDGCKQARIITASGDANVSGNAESLSVTTASGDIDLNGSAKSLKIVTVSGDAELNRVQTDLLECKTTSGDLNIFGEAREIEFRAVSGDVTMTLSGAVTEIRGSSISGDLNIRLSDGQFATVKANSTSGDIQMSCKDGPNAAMIALKTVSGDISVM